jgi:hypothetical protein
MVVAVVVVVVVVVVQLLCANMVRSGFIFNNLKILPWLFYLK